MSVRDFLLENLAGDLEYHPRRAILYFGLGAVFLGLWFFSTPDIKFTTIPLVFALGGLTLLVKGIFFLRKSSEGLGLTQRELSSLSNPSNRKALPNIPNQAAQVFQDFGAGPLLVWPLLHVAKSVNEGSSAPRVFPVFCIGGIIFFAGWLVRRLTSPESVS
jgi:hypothetical protein